MKCFCTFPGQFGTLGNICVNEKPFSATEPVVCLDEKPVSLHADIRPPHSAMTLGALLLGCYDLVIRRPAGLASRQQYHWLVGVSARGKSKMCTGKPSTLGSTGLSWINTGPEVMAGLSVIGVPRAERLRQLPSRAKE